MKSNPIIPYNKKLKAYARELRNNATPSELRVWDKIRKKQVLGYEFHRQVPIHEFIVDFYCHELKLAIEVDGPYHDFQLPKDGERQEILEGFGIEVIRFTNEEVFENVGFVVRKLEKRMRDRAES